MFISPRSLMAAAVPPPACGKPVDPVLCLVLSILDTQYYVDVI